MHSKLSISALVLLLACEACGIICSLFSYYKEQASDMAHMLPRKKQKIDHDVPAALRLGQYESGSQDSLPCFHDAAVQEGTPEPSGRLISGENAQSVGNCDFQTLK